MRRGKSSTVIPKRRPEHRRHDLQPGETVKRQNTRDSSTPPEEQPSFLSAQRNHGDDRHAELQRKLDKSRPARERHRARLPRRPKALLITTRIHQQRRVALERPPHILRRRRHSPVLLHQRPQTGKLEYEVVRELMKAPVGTEVVVERLRKHERIRDHRATRMVAHRRHGPLRRDSIQARDIRAEIDLRQRPQRRKRLTDVVRVASIKRIRRRPLRIRDMEQIDRREGIPGRRRGHPKRAIGRRQQRTRARLPETRHTAPHYPPKTRRTTARESQMSLLAGWWAAPRQRTLPGLQHADDHRRLRRQQLKPHPGGSSSANRPTRTPAA
jgi:hypothetical protein